MLFTRFLQETYPFYRGFLNLSNDEITITLPIKKLSAAIMQKEDSYLILTLEEISNDNKNKLNYLDYQLIDSDKTFQEQYELFKKIVQEKIAKDNAFTFIITERCYILNNLNINCKIK